MAAVRSRCTYTLTGNATKSSVFWNINYKDLYEVNSAGTKMNSRAVSNELVWALLRTLRSVRACTAAPTGRSRFATSSIEVRSAERPGATLIANDIRERFNPFPNRLYPQINNLDLALSTGTDGAGRAWVSGHQQLTGSWLTGDANVYMTHTLFTQQQQLSMPDNTTSTVMRNTMKISFNVTGWTFASASNRLVLEVKVRTTQTAVDRRTRLIRLRSVGPG